MDDREWGVLRDQFLSRYAAGTQRQFEGVLNQFRRWCDTQRIDVLEVTATDLPKYERALVRRGLAESSIRHHQTVITNFFRVLVEEGHLDRSPAARWRKLRPAENPASFLSTTDFRNLLAAASAKPADLALVCLLGVEGLSIAEICGADARDLVSPAPGELTLVIKSGTRRRSVPLMPQTIDAIRLHLRGRTQGPLFISNYKNRLDRHAATRVVRRVAKKAGILQSVSPQVLTNTSVAMLLDAGMPMKELQDATGRRDLRFLSRFSRPSVDSVATGRLKVWETFAGRTIEGDLLAQADRLLSESPAWPAAAIMLVGAGLEEFLRALVAASDAVPPTNPSLSSYADALRAVGAIDAKDRKRLGLWTDLRNQAAHGRGSDLTHDDAAEMLAGVRRFAARHR